MIQNIFLSSADFLKKLSVEKSFRSIIRVRVLNGLDQDQDRHFVGPDLGPNRLHR